MLTSIIVPLLTDWQQTMRCLDSIRRFADRPYELVLVDNGSTDGTSDWLRRQSGNDVVPVFNAVNRGFAAAINQGASAARGEAMVILNNDTLVSPRWLSQLLAALDDPGVGMAGPVSNYVLPLQKRPGEYGDAETFFVFADRFNRHDPARWRHATALSGFCMALKRRVWDTVGPMDERFGYGGYEDIDYGYRVMRAGLKLRLAGDIYIHHDGNRSFSRNGLDMYAIASDNRRKFIRKWGFNPERLILHVDPGFLHGSAAEPRHPRSGSAVPGGWYGMDDTGGVYRVERGKKRPVVSLAALVRCRLSPDRISRAAAAILKRLPEGVPIDPGLPDLQGYPDSFLASDPAGGLYLVSHGIRYMIRGAAALAAWNLPAEEAIPLAYDELQALPLGWPVDGDPWETFELLDYRLLNGPDGRLYYSEGQRLRRVADPSVLSVYGLNPARAVPIPAPLFPQLPVVGPDLA